MSNEVSRRQLLKILAATAGAAALSSVPNQWKTPVVDVGMLPAHAQGLSGLGAISGTVEVRIPTAPVGSHNPTSPLDIPVDTVPGGYSASAAYDHTTAGVAYFPYTINNVPAGTYTVRCYYCAVYTSVPNVVVIAGQTTTGVDFLVDECLICLSGDDLIDTPIGAVRVADLKVGMPVWTLDATGLRIPTVVKQTVRRPVLPNASIIHLALSDGREVMVSGPHPLTDGRSIGDLAVGDLLDGARVVKAENIPYDQPAKYDVLPAGETGSYWANGIPMNSTIEMTEKAPVRALA
jgi:hypothetical protein